MEENPVPQTQLFGSPNGIAESFDSADDETALPSSASSIPLINDQTSLAACAQPYRQELMLRGKSNYTITCFLSDLKMLSDFIGPDEPVGRLTKEHLTDWLMKLKFGTRGQVPAPKTMARRVTFLKNFFSWLAHEEIIMEDPSSTLALMPNLVPHAHGHEYT